VPPKRDLDSTDSERAYVQVPADFFQMSDEEAAPIDETIADAIMRQLGITDDE
jgi:hypothetical protein